MKLPGSCPVKVCKSPRTVILQPLWATAQSPSLGTVIFPLFPYNLYIQTTRRIIFITDTSKHMYFKTTAFQTVLIGFTNAEKKPANRIHITYLGMCGPFSAHIVNTSGVPVGKKSGTFYNHIYSQFFAVIVFPEQSCTYL